MTASSARELDIVLLGASGFAGRLAAQHLAKHAPTDVRIGLAGRSPERLADVRSSLGSAAQNWPLITLDATDETAAAALAARARVVATTVGPYLRYGLPLVRACAEAGTDYVDLTGETLFVRRSIDTCHELAQASGARIVHSCGFDSVPSDLGVGLTAAAAAAAGQGQLTETVLHVRSIRAGVSGGTIDSLRQQIIEVLADPSLRGMVTSATALVDGPSPARPRKTGRPKNPLGVGQDPRSKEWQTRFVMGGFNRQIVLRSNALANWAYGPDFRYREVVDTGSGAYGVVKASVISAGSTALMVGMLFGPTRRLLDALLPDPGKGPSDKFRSRGHFLVDVDSDTTTGARFRTRIGADIDPAYDGAALMLSESALSLACDTSIPHAGGVLTPMAAMGEALAVRLRNHGFTVTSEALPLT